MATTCWWMVPSWFHKQTTADGIVADPALQVIASNVQTAGPASPAPL